MEELPVFHQLLKAFVRSELLPWQTVEEVYGAQLKATPAFTENADRWEDLRKRVVEKNIRVIAGYYSRISLKRLSELLALPAEIAEQYLSDLVVKKTIYARTDRPAGIVTFRPSKTASDVLNEWSSGLGYVLSENPMWPSPPGCSSHLTPCPDQCSHATHGEDHTSGQQRENGPQSVVCAGCSLRWVRV